MSVNPLCVATEGYLDNTIAKASSGYICTLEIVIPDQPRGNDFSAASGGSGKGQRWQNENQYYDIMARDRFEAIKREDDELISIIAVIGSHIL